MKSSGGITFVSGTRRKDSRKTSNQHEREGEKRADRPDSACTTAADRKSSIQTDAKAIAT